jgi:putative ABC transport system permease protein
LVSALQRKLGRDVRASWLLLAAIASIMATGVGLHVAMRSAQFSLADAQRRHYAACRMADFSIEMKKVPLSELAFLEQMPGVTEIRPRLQFYVTVDLEQATEPLNGLVLSLPEQRQPVINDILLQRGSYFGDQRAEEVIVSDTFARKHRLQPGDRIHLVLNNRHQELVIVGTAISSEFVYLIGRGGLVPDPDHFGVFYLKQRFLEEVFDFQGACNQVVGLLDPEVRERPEDLLRQAEQRLAVHGVFGTTPRKNHPPHRFVSDYIREIGTLATFVPAMFLAVGALVLSMLMTRLTEQQRTIIGTLKALGYTDRQVLLHFLRFGVVVGLAGGVAGCGFGYALSGYLVSVYHQFFEFPDLATRFYPGINALSVLVSLGCALAGTAWGVRRVLRLHPAEAMRPKPPPQGGAIFLERLGWLWRRLDTGWRMVLRNLARNRVRSLVGVFACAMAAGLLVYGFILDYGWTFLVQFQFQQVLRSDVDLTFKEERGHDALTEASHLPAVTHAEPLLAVPCTFRNGAHQKRAAITGLLPDARLTVPHDRGGRPVRVQPTGLTMSRSLAEILRLAPGDPVTVEPIKGLREARTVPVVEITDAYLGLDAYAEIHYLSELIHEEFAVSGVQLQTETEPGSLAPLYREVKELPGLEGFSARAGTRANLNETLVKGNRVGTVMMVMFAGVIFFCSTLNASLIALAERRGEVAVLLNLGYSRWAVGSLFLRESLLINIAGTLLGVPLGYMQARGMSVLFNTELVRLPVLFPPSLWAWAMGLSLVFTLISYGFVQRSIHQMDLLEQGKRYD